MNKKQSRTLVKIFEKPTRADIKWDDVQSLLNAFGADIREGSGSRVLAILNRQILRIHKPHPKKELPKWAVEAVRDFLESANIQLDK
jgi:hypothetical protein